MLIVPIILLIALAIVVAVARSKKKKGEITESSYRMVISASSIVVTIGALVVMFLRIRG
jgi:hypothetical protein